MDEGMLFWGVLNNCTSRSKLPTANLSKSTCNIHYSPPINLASERVTPINAYEVRTVAKSMSMQFFITNFSLPVTGKSYRRFALENFGLRSSSDISFFIKKLCRFLQKSDRI